MPPLPAAAGVIKVTLTMTVGGDTSALNRFYIHYSGTAPTPAQMNAFATSIQTAWNTRLAALHGSNISLTFTAVEDLTSASGATGFDATNHAGTRAGSVLTAATCAMVQFFILRRYRGGKPKIFLPAGTATDLASNQTWTGGFISAMTTAWTNFIGDIVAAGWTGAGTLTHVNVSYFLGFTVVTNPITHRARNVPTLRGVPVVDTVTGYGTESGLASQRRRNQV